MTSESGGPRPDPWPSIYDYGVIGNLRTAALVSKDGSVDWACFPRFDSPSVFARLLDRRSGGFHRIVPRAPYRSYQQYVTGTNILTTFFELGRGRALTLTDFMPVGPSAAEVAGEARILRRIHARGGPIELAIESDVRPDYGRETVRWSIEDHAATANGGRDSVVLTAPWDWVASEGRVGASGTLSAGSTAFAQISWGGPPPADPAPSALLAVADAYWRGWVSPADAPLRRVAARWHPWVERSELVLKLLSYANTGVFVAAPTTSLPESLGGSRNWDYRYVWLRDAAFTAQVFLLLGHVAEARAYVGWALDRVGSDGPDADLHTLYAVDGSRPPTELELPQWEGFEGSRPVRVGNAASDQRQLDIYGEVLDSAALLERVDPAFVRDRWPRIQRIADRTTELWSTPDSGIWELRGEPAHYVHSKLMCWVALDRAIHLAETFGQAEPVDRWRRVADEIRAAILARGYDEQRGVFVQAFDRPNLDAASLRIPIAGFLPPGDPRVVSTMEAVERDLSVGPFVRRYEGDDGLGLPEGSFLLCAFWLVEALARSGQTDRALARWSALLDASSPLLLFAEEFDPAAHRPLGNYPQAFTHIGVLRAALALGLVGSDH